MILYRNIKQPTIPRPIFISNDDKNRLTVLLWGKEIAIYISHLEYIDSNLKSIYSMIYGKCSKALKEKLVQLITKVLKDINVTVWDCLHV